MIITDTKIRNDVRNDPIRDVVVASNVVAPHERTLTTLPTLLKEDHLEFLQSFYLCIQEETKEEKGDESTAVNQSLQQCSTIKFYTPWSLASNWSLQYFSISHFY